MEILALINQCSSPALGAILSAFKKIMTLIQIVVPILLMISLATKLAKMVSHPEDKKTPVNIKNSVIAAALVFFIPMLVNAVMGMVDNSYEISACWNETKAVGQATEYVDPNNGSGKKAVVPDSGDYEKGKKKQNNNSNSNSNNNNNNNGSNGNYSNNSSLPSTPGDISGDLQVHFINPSSRVDAIYIKVGNVSMFIDGGFKSDGKREMAYLDKIGVTHIDYYMASHSHKNHVEAGPAIIAKYGISKVIVGRETCSGSGSTPCSWYAIQGYARNQGITLNASMEVLTPGEVFYMGGLKLTCIGPMTVYNGMQTTVTKQNYNSLLVRLDYGSTSFLLTGDNASAGTMKETNAKFPGMLNVDVLKNPHHNGCTGEAYKLSSPEYVVFTTRHDYLPSSSCINTVKTYGAKYYFIVTDNYDGNVLFTSDGSKINAYPKYKGTKN